MTHYTQHIAGEMGLERIQLCTQCGELIMDNSNHPDLDAKGFAPGPVYKGESSFIFGDGPVTTKYLAEGDTFEKCTG